jgi:hypothetical protein
MVRYKLRPLYSVFWKDDWWALEVDVAAKRKTPVVQPYRHVTELSRPTELKKKKETAHGFDPNILNTCQTR